jgi:hypothetical protein
VATVHSALAAPSSLEDVSCVDYRKVHYYVGIDCGLTGAKRNLYVKVRALNLAEQKWVTGFGRFWEGKPNKTQMAALKREHPDEYLRGLRPLPFSNHQPDLLAAYLARNLSCLLQQGEADDLVVYVTSPSANTPEFFKTTLDLVGKYLARFREVRVTDDPNQSNVTVVTAIHSIHQDLHQIWVSARHRQGKKYLPGAETEAYVMINAQKEILIAGMSQAKPSEPLTPFQSVSTASEIISSFDLLTPLNQRFCAAERPWRSGVHRLDPHESVWRLKWILPLRLTSFWWDRMPWVNYHAYFHPTALLWEKMMPYCQIRKPVFWKLVVRPVQKEFTLSQSRLRSWPTCLPTGSKKSRACAVPVKSFRTCY